MELVDDVEHRHRDEGRDIEPNGHVEAGFVALADREQHVDPEGDLHESTMMSMGQMSSAYSFPWVKPIGRVMEAPRMMSCQPQKWILERRSEAMRHLQSRWSE